MISHMLYNVKIPMCREVDAMISDKEIQEMKDLIKQGREKGKVLHFTKAFEIYPVEEEAHRGILEYCTKGELKNEV